jgi:hypothetical protein
MYDPPSETNWFYTGPFLKYIADAYNEGYQAAQNGEKEENNPYEESGHERDTTFEDDQQYWWWSGYNDFFDTEK